MKNVKTLSEISQLPLGTKLYEPTATQVKWYYYGGINPKEKNSIILISAGSVQEMHGFYMGDNKEHTFYLDYDEAYAVLLENAKKNVDTVQRIFIDRKSNA